MVEAVLGRPPLDERVNRAMASLCSMRDGFRVNGDDGYADRTQYVIEILMGGKCPKGGDHFPVTRLTHMVCEKCGVPL
jgi:hypothetical protein